MNKQTVVTFRVRDKGGPSGGKTISQSVPEFELADFMKTPNAEEFVKKAYYANVKKIMREVEERKNGSTLSDLQSTEAIVARSLAFTKEEISDWVSSRDWSKASQVKDIEKVKVSMVKYLPQLAMRKNPFSTEIAVRIADVVIAAVADSPDPVADYLFSVLTLPQSPSDDSHLML
ncbi:MAG: hypothetical protein IPI20_14035 [Rhodoferax sp.]|jgi:hypothetical protein|nr:hypothetical protein [Rhodoferax sp.]